MAELVVGESHRFIVRPEGALVGRRSNDGTFRPDIDLAVVEGGVSVSRHHARIFLRDGNWFIEVEPTVTNVTEVGGRPVAAGQEAAIKDGDEIRLGKVALLFQAGPEPAAPPPEPPIGLLQPTAALDYEGQAFPLAAMEGNELTLGRHSDDRTYNPEVDLGDLPYGRTISRRHGRLFQRNGQWFLRVEAEVTNPTLLNGQRLAKGQEVALEDGNQLQLGRVIVTFKKLAPIPVVNEELIELIVEPAHVAVEAGREARSTVTVVNHTGHVDWFRIEIEGLQEAWYRILLPDGTVATPAQVRLFHTAAHVSPAPDAVAQLTVVFAPPREYQSRAGAHDFAITATTQGEPRARRVTAGQLMIRPFDGLVLKIEPEEIVRTRAEFKIDLHNKGNDQIPVAVVSEGNGLDFQWDHTQIALNNGAYAQLKLQAKAKKRHWLGMDRRYAFVVVARSGEQELRERAWLACPPRVPIWIQTLYQRFQWMIAPFMMIFVLVAIAYAFARPPQIKDFKAEPASVIVGTPVNLSWSLDRANSVSIEPSSGTEVLKVPSGELDVAPAASTKYTLTARNMFGIPSSRSVSVDVKPAPQLPKILSFSASTERIKKEGEPVTLRWQTDGAANVIIEPADEVKEIKPSGEIVVHPSKNNATYKLVATNDAGAADAIKTITIEPPQIVSFSANPESVVQGGEVRLRWAAQGFTKMTIKASKGEVVQGTQELEVPADVTDQIVRPLEDTEYTLTASNAGGSDIKSVKVTASPMQITFFKAEPSTIPKGEVATLSWSVQGATSVSIEPGIGTVAPGETSRSVKPENPTEYTLTATGPDNKQVQQKVNVEVTLGAVKIDFFTAAPPAITRGEQATLTFSVQNAKTITIHGSDGSTRNVAASQPVTTGSINVSPGATTTYTLTASNDSGQGAAPATVEVRAPSPTPAPPPPPAPQPPPG